MDSSEVKIKSDLTQLMRDAAASKDPKALERLYGAIVTKGNELRKKHGVPERSGDVFSPVLKSTFEQLQCAQVGNASVLGGCIYDRSCVPREKRKGDLFHSFFSSSDEAKEYHARVLSAGKQYLSDKEDFVVYPPLLMRSNEEVAILFHITEEGLIIKAGPTTPANALLAMFKTGPIIPVVSKSVRQRAWNLLISIYSLYGTISPANLKKFILRQIEVSPPKEMPK